MRKIFALIFIVLLHVNSFAYTPLQIVIENSEISAPPTPNEAVGISPFDVGQQDYDNTPIDFVVPFLLLTVVALMIYIVKYRKQKLV
ncbi:hypothetical protein ETU10_04750 [Apibacter muscae]|uniref:hypothetical protein n=1 Tax=Apibacter muscae TaxID=2509004 RepID=UPI0011ADBA8C|nr:hypothetical protein [Apibacter muscae]TWP23994.1 hypothetical protein ETU10_04750 [Apibacter muscae]